MRWIYANPNDDGTRATKLGCGWRPTVPTEYASIATAPCVILDGNGQQTVLPDDGTLTAQQVQTAAAPLAAAEQAAAATAAANAANAQTLQQRAAAALTANVTYLNLASPTAAQTTTQTKAITRQINAIIRLLVVQDTSTITDS